MGSVLNLVKGNSDIYPMANGNKWTYDIYVNNVKAGTETDEMSLVTTKDGLTTATVRVVQTDSSSGTEQSVTQQLRKTSQDITQGSDNGVSVIVLKLPLTQGTSWTIGSLPVSVTGQEDVVVKAGTYAGCYKISGQLGGATATNWYAPGVGLVKSQVVNGTQQSRQELATVQIN
jgi:hypothetical protein